MDKELVLIKLILGQTEPVEPAGCLHAASRDKLIGQLWCGGGWQLQWGSQVETVVYREVIQVVRGGKHCQVEGVHAQ